MRDGDAWVGRWMERAGSVGWRCVASPRRRINQLSPSFTHTHHKQSFYRLLPDSQPSPSSTTTKPPPQPLLHQMDASTTPPDAAVAATGNGEGEGEGKVAMMALGAAREDVARLLAGLQALEVVVQGAAGELEEVSGFGMDGWMEGDGWMDDWLGVCASVC